MMQAKKSVALPGAQNKISNVNGFNLYGGRRQSDLSSTHTVFSPKKLVGVTP